MSTYDDLIDSVTVRHNDKILSTCSGVFDFFGFNQFYYVKITDQGYFSTIDSHAAFAEYWTSEKCYLNYPYYRHPKFYKEGLSVIQNVENKNLRAFLDPLRNMFNFQSWIRVINKLPDGMEEFGFSSCSIFNNFQCSQILNEIGLLRAFLKIFKIENKNLFSKIEDRQINIAELIGPDFYKNDMPIIPQSVGKKALLEKLGIEIGPPLTLREVEIAKLLLAGYSARKIASQVYLSKRTVEHAIERLKEKLSCQSKSELVQKARELEHFGCLSLS